MRFTKKLNKLTVVTIATFATLVTLLFSFSNQQAMAQQKNSYAGHGSESVNPEQLKQYAPPALEAQLANGIKKMLDIAAPGMGMLSPDNKKLYFGWKVTGVTQVWVIDGPQKFPQQLTSGNDAVSLSDVSRDGKFLILSKDLNGQENPGLYRMDLKTNLIEELFRKEKVQARFSFLSEDSKTLYFTANDKKPDSYNIYKMDLESRGVELVFEGDGVWAIADQKNNAKDLLLVKYRGGMINEFYDYNVQSKALVPIIGQGLNEEYSVSYSAFANEYLVATFKDDFKRLFRYKEKKMTQISPENLNWNVEDVSIDEKRQRILYTVNRGGFTELFALNAKTYRPIKLPQFQLAKGIKADHVFAGSTSSDGTMTMFGIVSAQSPRVSYSYNWGTKKLTQWVLPSAPEVELTRFAVSELLEYETRDGVKIPMFVRYPVGCKESKNCPVVVHFHGGPEGQSTAGFNPYAQMIVNAGFIFVDPNVRGSDGYGKRWIESDNGPEREKVITDIEDASIWIKKNWKNKDGLSPKVGVMGWSYGGYSTLMAMTRFAGAYEVGVALVGMSNLVSFLNNTAPYRRILRISEYGDPVKDKEALLKLSPTTYLDKVKDPLMIIQGANDPRVPAGEAIQIHEMLKKKKIASELIIFADEGHGSAKKENQVLEMGHVVSFFKKHLK